MIFLANLLTGAKRPHNKHLVTTVWLRGRVAS